MKNSIIGFIKIIISVYIISYFASNGSCPINYSTGLLPVCDGTLLDFVLHICYGLIVIIGLFYLMPKLYNKIKNQLNKNKISK